MKTLSFQGQTGFYRGKVRDVFYFGQDHVLMIASDRLSAFDVILPAPIPFKGQVLNEIAAYMMEECKNVCPAWLVETPTADSSLGKRCKPFKIEMVVRGNLTGHAWRTYISGKRSLCGIALPDGMKENDYFPNPIITPSTKATEGHDEDISSEEIIRSGLATTQEWSILSKYALSLFEKGKVLAATRGLILADTKYEFGKIGDEIYLMDEIHTPDSSRYFYAEGFEERLESGEKQKQLSKEFVREWLMENNFMGKEGEAVPTMSEARVKSISERYIELFEAITGKEFTAQALSAEERFERIQHAVDKLQ